MLISRRAYAKLHGVDEKTIRKAIDAGKIPVVEGKIDPEIADAAWLQNRDGAQDSKLADAIASAAAPAQAATAATAAPAASVAEAVVPYQPDLPPVQPQLALTPLTAARVRATDASAAIREITRRKLEGSLLEAEEVDRTWSEMLQVLKDRLRQLPDDIAPLLVGCREEAEIRSVLMREVMNCLTAMSKGLEGMAA